MQVVYRSEGVGYGADDAVVHLDFPAALSAAVGPVEGEAGGGGCIKGEVCRGVADKARGVVTEGGLGDEEMAATAIAIRVV